MCVRECVRVCVCVSVRVFVCVRVSARVFVSVIKINVCAVRSRTSHTSRRKWVCVCVCLCVCLYVGEYMYLYVCTDACVREKDSK